jgi:Leucine-rich repeat (LRR) protein
MFLINSSLQAKNNGMIYQLPSSEYNALVSLYGSAGGSGWTQASGWLNGSATAWFGVTVTGVGYDTNGNAVTPGHVVYLKLPNNHVTGSIPTTISALAWTQVLDFDTNSTSGDLSLFGTMDHMQQLRFYQNHITGDISLLQNFPNLVDADLGLTQVTGNISAMSASGALKQFSALDTAVTGNLSSLSGLTNLATLYLNSSAVSGNLSSISNLRYLQGLDLGYTQVAGSLHSISGLAELQILNLSGDPQLVGDLSYLEGLSKLQSLNFHASDVTGDLSSIEPLQNLTNLDLFNDLATGFLVGGDIGSISALTQLSTLDIHGNGITGDFSAVSGMAALAYLDFYGNGVSGDLSDLEAPNLYHLDLNGNSITGVLGDLSSPNLNYLDLSGNQITGNISKLAGLSQLYYLDLSGDGVSGSLTSISGLNQLENLYLSANAISGDLSALAGLHFLNDLDVSTNNLTGDLSGIAELDLQSFNGSGNDLTGDLTPLANLTDLQYLSAALNNLNGSLSSLANLTNLWFLNLSGNSLSQTLDPLTNLTSLQNLDLSTNNFTGDMSAVDDLYNLTALNLSQNEITGVIPTDLGDFAALSSIDLSHNMLTGTVPPSLGDMLSPSYIDLGENYLSGVVPNNLTNFSTANSLTFLGLANNDLIGPFPDLLGFTGFLEITNNWLDSPDQNISLMLAAGQQVDYLPQGMGIDISYPANQPTTADFFAIRNQGYHYAIVGGWGGNSINLNAQLQLQNASEAGLLTAGYCLLNLNSASPTFYDGARQVRNALAAFGPQAANLGFLALDVEIVSSNSQLLSAGLKAIPPDPMAQSQALIVISNAARQVAAVGLPLIIYSNSNSWWTITGDDDEAFPGVALWEYKIITNQFGHPSGTAYDITMPPISYGAWTGRAGKQFLQNVSVATANGTIPADLDIFQHSAFGLLPNPNYQPLNLTASITFSASGQGSGGNKTGTITWTSSVLNLESTTSLNGLWTIVPNATSPFTFNFSDPVHFYRVR